MSILQHLPRPFMVLAPMDDVTDTVFRQMVGSTAPPDVYFTEFVNVDGLQSPGRPNLLKKIQFTPHEQPLIAQIWGKNPDNFYKTAQELVEMGFAGVDLNMGCPAKPVVKDGCGSALINNRDLALQIIQATKDGIAGRVPLSVKTRIGWNTIDLSWPELLLQQDLAMLTIHGRTKKEMSDVPAHWDVIGQIKQLRDRVAPQTLLVGNGDVQNRAHAHQLAEQYGLDGIMIGRGIFKDPYAFAEVSPWEGIAPAAKIDLYARHVQLFADTWTTADRRIAVLNKFCKVYINGFDGAKELRESLMHATSTEELLKLLEAAQSSLAAQE